MKSTTALVVFVAYLTVSYAANSFFYQLATNPDQIKDADPYCNCESCKCVPRNNCTNEAIVPGSWCPGSYIYTCCNMNLFEEIEAQQNSVPKQTV